MPLAYVIAGPVGSGKTTMMPDLIPEGMAYIDADHISKKLSEINDGKRQETVLEEKVFDMLFDKHVSERESFGYETRLDTLDSWGKITYLQNQGYEVRMNYITVDNPLILKERIKNRVIEGGVSLSDQGIEESFNNSHKILAANFSSPERISMIDTSTLDARLVVTSEKGKVTYITVNNPPSHLKEFFHDVNSHFTSEREKKSLSNQIDQSLSKGNGIEKGN